MKHSPLPWKMSDVDEHSLRDAQDKWIGRIYFASHIDRKAMFVAVNHFERLLEAAKKSLEKKYASTELREVIAAIEKEATGGC